jgi:hypothetical protein
VIQYLQDNFAPLPATEEQLDRIAKLTARASEVLTDFNPREGEVTDRTEANKELYRLRRMLSAVEFRSTVNDASDFIADGDAPAASAVADSGDVPF